MGPDFYLTHNVIHSLEECRDKCLSESFCLFYTYIPVTELCALKNSGKILSDRTLIDTVVFRGWYYGNFQMMECILLHQMACILDIECVMEAV